jgi:hypothetical protein
MDEIKMQAEPQEPMIAPEQPAMPEQPEMPAEPASAPVVEPGQGAPASNEPVSNGQ